MIKIITSGGQLETQDVQMAIRFLGGLKNSALISPRTQEV